MKKAEEKRKQIQETFNTSIGQLIEKNDIALVPKYNSNKQLEYTKKK